MDYRKLVSGRRETAQRIERLKQKNEESQKKIAALTRQLEEQIAAIQEAEDLRRQELKQAENRLHFLDAAIEANLKNIDRAGIHLTSKDCSIPNLGMHNRKVMFPLGRCLLHDCLLELQDITEHRCFSKSCHYYENLE